MFKVGDRVKVREATDLHKNWWGLTGTIAEPVEKSEGFDYDWAVQLDSHVVGATTLVTYEKELELIQ